MRDPNRLPLGFRVALEMAAESPCVRRHVGAVLMQGKRIVSTGYNGPASGLPHRTEEPGPNQCIRIGHKSGTSSVHACCVHAESNCITFADRQDCIGADLYCTDSPCSQCADAIINARIARVLCLKPYADTDGLDKLRSVGIEVIMHGVSE